MRGRNLSKHALEISIPHPKTGRTQTALTFSEHLLQVLHGRVLCPFISFNTETEETEEIEETEDRATKRQAERRQRDRQIDR